MRYLKYFMGVIAIIAMTSINQTKAEAANVNFSHKRVSQSTIDGVVEAANQGLEKENQINVSLPTFPSYGRTIEINVLDAPYNADNTGKKHATNALQKALDEAKEGASEEVRYKIIVPKGTYLTRETLRIYSNTWLCLDKDATIRSEDGTNGLLVSGSLNEKNSGYDGISNVIVEGGTWDGHGSWLYDGDLFSRSLIRFGHGKNILINNLTVKEDINGHHMEFCGIKNLAVTNCSLSGYYGEAKKEAIQIDMTHDAGSAPGFENFDDTHCQNVIIYNCNFNDLQRGVGTHSALVGEYYTDILIAKNTFENIKLQAIYALNYKRCIIYDNVMKNVGTGIMLKYWVGGSSFYKPNLWTAKENDADTDTLIRGNEITTKMDKAMSVGYGIQCSGGTYTGDKFPSRDYCMDNLTIYDNTIYNAYDAGIALNYVHDSLVGNNKIVDVKKNSVNGGSSANGIILKYSYGCDIAGNTIEKSARNGIYLLNSEAVKVNQSNNTIRENTVAGCGNNVVMLSSSSASVKDNEIMGTGKNSCGIYAKTSTIEVSRNEIMNNGYYGIGLMENVKATITDNVLSSEGDGIYVSDDSKSNVLSLGLDSIGTLYHTDTLIRGGTVNGNIVNLYSDGALIGTGQVVNNVYEINYPSQKSGKTITVEAEDNGGNIVMKESKVITNFSTPVLGTIEPQDYCTIKVSWEAVDLAEGYYIYRKTEGSSWSKIGTVKEGKTTKYLDKTAETATNYYYTVKAYDFTNTSECDRIGIFGATSLDKTGSITYTYETNSKTKETKTTINWEAVKGASGYRILVLDEDGQWTTYKTIQDGKKTSYTLKETDSEQSSTFTVRAFRKEGERTIWSDYDTKGKAPKH